MDNFKSRLEYNILENELNIISQLINSEKYKDIYFNSINKELFLCDKHKEFLEKINKETDLKVFAKQFYADAINIDFTEDVKRFYFDLRVQKSNFAKIRLFDLKENINIDLELLTNASKVIASIKEEIKYIEDKTNYNFIEKQTQEEDLNDLKYNIINEVVEDCFETNLMDLDNTIKLKRGDLTVIAGATGSGKSTFSLQIANNMSKEHDVCFVSLEMKRNELIKKIICSELDINSYTIEYNKLTSYDKERIKDFRLSSRLKLIDYSGYTLEELENIIVSRKQDGLDVLFIDHLHFMKINGSNTINVISEITSGLKRLAMKFDVSIVLLSQINRGVSGKEDKRPMLSDLRSCGSIEQDANAVIMLYNDYYYSKNINTNNVLEVLIRKARGYEAKDLFCYYDFAKSQIKNITGQKLNEYISERNKNKNKEYNLK